MSDEEKDEDTEFPYPFVVRLPRAPLASTKLVAHPVDNDVRLMVDAAMILKHELSTPQAAANAKTLGWALAIGLLLGYWHRSSSTSRWQREEFNLSAAHSARNMVIMLGRNVVSAESRVS